MNSDDLITNELVSETLLKDKGAQAKLVGWTQEPGAAFGNNFFNVINRIKVRFVEGNEEKTTSYVAKINPCKPNDAFNPYRQRAVLKEVFFYETLLPLLNAELQKMAEGPLKVPKYFHSSIDEGKEVIIFEDLGLKGFETFPRKNLMDDAHSTIMATELSRLHAASLALQKNYSEDLATVYPLLVESWHCPEFNLRDAFAKVFQKGMLLNISLVKALGGYQDLLPWLECLLERTMEAIKKEMVATPPWRGINHGDYHRTNVLFKYDQERNPIDIMVLDWQTVRMSNIASEIGYFAYSSLNYRSRKQDLSLVANVYFTKFKQISGLETFFSTEDLLKEADSNQHGLLICFYLIPLSLCVTEQSELFKVDPEEFNKYTSKEANMKAIDYLKNVPFLSEILMDYLEELKRKNMHNTH